MSILALLAPLAIFFLIGGLPIRGLSLGFLFRNVGSDVDSLTNAFGGHGYR